MKIENYKDYIQVTLSCGRTAKISLEDVKFVNIFSHWRWRGGYVTVSRYIPTEFGQAKEEYYFHRLIMGSPKGFDIDHINRDKMDNRRDNLRLCSRGENSCNKAKAKGITSEYRGVAHSKVNKKKPWRAYISKNGKTMHLGYFHTPQDAAAAYNKMSIVLWGSFAYINHI